MPKHFVEFISHKQTDLFLHFSKPKFINPLKEAASTKTDDLAA